MFAFVAASEFLVITTLIFSCFVALLMWELIQRWLSVGDRGAADNAVIVICSLLLSAAIAAILLTTYYQILILTNLKGGR